MEKNNKQDKVTISFIATYCKSKGFVYQNSSIYGGLANAWDYAPLGVQLKRNIKEAWWRYFIDCRIDMVGLDSAILMNSKVWKTSGHIENFSDPLIDCKNCQNRFRADSLIAEQLALETEGLSILELQTILDKNPKITCGVCNESSFTSIREFNLMFKTHQGVIKDSKNEIYLRPETAQGIFVQFKNILQTTRKKIPFGVGQIGKSFRNEITPGNFIFRTREFEQMEIEYFVEPSKKETSFNEWLDYSFLFFTKILGLNPDKLRKKEQQSQELAHYSDKTTDIEFLFEDFWGEIAGIASRKDYDLKLHQESSQEDLAYFDPVSREKYLPFVIEPSFGVDRLFLTVLMDAYCQEILPDGKMRTVLKIKPSLAPIFVAVLPLKKNDSTIVAMAKKTVQHLSLFFKTTYDDTGSIGKLYRRQDEIGTPFCITIDFDSLEDKAVTVRNRDSMTQERILIDDLVTYLQSFLKFD